MTYLTKEWYCKDISTIKIIRRDSSGKKCNIQYSDIEPGKYFIHRYGGDPMMAGMKMGFKMKAKELRLRRYPGGKAWPYIEVKKDRNNKLLEKSRVLPMSLSSSKYINATIQTIKTNPNCNTNRRYSIKQENSYHMMRILIHVVFGHAFYPEYFEDFFNNRHIMHHTGPRYDYRAHKVKPIPYGDNYSLKNIKSRKEEYESFVRREGYCTGGAVGGGFSEIDFFKINKELTHNYKKQKKIQELVQETMKSVLSNYEIK